MLRVVNFVQIKQILIYCNYIITLYLKVIESLNFLMTCLSKLFYMLIDKVWHKCKLTNLETIYGLMEVKGLIDHQTGDLTIRNIQRDQYGYYNVEIKTRTIFLHRKYQITMIGEYFSFLL